MSGQTLKEGDIMSAPGRVLTGVAGLDDMLCGGLIAGSAALVQGAPGIGKTTLGMQFLVKGAGVV